MGELVIKIPGIELDEKTKSELKEDIKSVIRLRLARELLLKRMDSPTRELITSFEIFELYTPLLCISAVSQLWNLV